MSDIFRFKRFAVDQTGCAMKVNTDGVVLGAMASKSNPRYSLDIGTGTGVIALMLAQRFPDAQIDAIEIDADAAAMAKHNFAQSDFSQRLQLYAGDFKAVLANAADKKYNLIVSNPPFYLDALHSPKAQNTVAKHADVTFFEDLLQACAKQLTANGQCWFILPINTAELVINLAGSIGLHLQETIYVKSFADSVSHRAIVAFDFAANKEALSNELVIYNAPRVYTQSYQNLLKDFLIIF